MHEIERLIDAAQEVIATRDVFADSQLARLAEAKIAVEAMLARARRRKMPENKLVRCEFTGKCNSEQVPPSLCAAHVGVERETTCPRLGVLIHLVEVRDAGK